jgi:hypothetical protein
VGNAEHFSQAGPGGQQDQAENEQFFHGASLISESKKWAVETRVLEQFSSLLSRNEPQLSLQANNASRISPSLSPKN